MPYERYEATTGGTAKFWEITWKDNGLCFVVFWGLAGDPAPMSRTFNFNGQRQAKNARDREIRVRLRQRFKLVFSKPGVKPGWEITLGLARPGNIKAKPKGKTLTTLIIDERTSERQTAGKPKDKFGRKQRRLRF